MSNSAPTLEQVTEWLGGHFKPSPHWLHVADPTRDLMHEFDLPLNVRRKVRQMIFDAAATLGFKREGDSLGVDFNA